MRRNRRVLLVAVLGVLASPPAAHAQQPSGRRAPDPATAARTIEIQANDNMRFTPARIDARPGEPLHVALKNVGTMPNTAMAHNFVLLRKGADPRAFADKSATARGTNFIAPALKDEILASTTLVGPGETAEVTFTAPDKPGDYTFICSYPGHFVVGMRGTLVVK